MEEKGEAGHGLLHARPVVKKMEANDRSLSNTLKKYTRKVFSRENLKRRVPILEWLPKYNLECLEGDVLAGFTVGLTVIPQGIAYANVAGLEPNYGLYSAFMGCFIYMFFGSCKDITIGPTAIMAIMTHEYSGHGGADFAILLCFLSGVIILAAGVCNLGFLITFISKPVISGFTSAAAITIASTQLKGLFGLKFSAEGIIETCQKLIANINGFRWQDFTLGLCCIVCLLSMRKMKDMNALKPKPNDQTHIRILRKVGFLFSVGRNAVIVIVAAIIASSLDASGQPFTITGDVKAGLPKFQLPPFSTVVNNETLSFSEMMSDLGAGVGIIPLISILESIAIASAFAGSKTIDATQEMLALGLCNLAGSFIQSMPVTGSFSRTAVNSTSGVRTAAGGVVTGGLVILALAVLTPYFKYIPKATLSAVIICAVIFMVEYEAVLPMWRVRRLDMLPLWGTFLTCLFWKLEYGILVGVVINICVLLFGIAKTKVEVNAIMKQDDETAYVVVQPHDGLFFPSVDHVRAQVSKAGVGAAQGTIPVVIDCSHFTGVDYTAAKGIKGICTEFDKRQQTLIFTNVQPSLKNSLSYLYENIKIAPADQLHNVLRITSPIAAITGISTNAHNNIIPSNEDRRDPEATNPLLGATASDPKPVIRERTT